MQGKNLSLFTKSKFHLFIVVFTTILLLIGLFFGLKIILYPYQHEVREGASLVVVQNFIKGINPYSFQVHPQGTYVYGFLYPYLSVPLNFLFGIGIAPMRMMNLLFIILSAFLIFMSSYRENHHFTLSYLLSSLFFLSMITKNLFAYPNALGILFLLSTVVLAHRYLYSNKSLFLCVFLSVITFFIKPYYIIGIGFICAYLFLFLSPKKSIIIFVSFLGVLALSLLATYFIWPLYINNNLLHHMGVASYIFSYMVNQVFYFLGREFLLICVYSLFVGLAIRKNIHDIKKVVTVYDFAIIISFICFIFKLGGHDGSGSGDYLYDLLYPFIFLSIGVTGKNFDISKLRFIVPVILLLLCGIQVSRLYHLTKPLAGFADQISPIEEYFKKSQNILSSSDIVPLAIKYNVKVHDSGQSIYFTSGSKLGVELLYGNKITSIDADYKTKIKNDIIHKKYDYILKSWIGDYALPSDFTNYYHLETEISHLGIRNGGNIEVWIPN